MATPIASVPLLQTLCECALTSPYTSLKLGMLAVLSTLSGTIAIKQYFNPGPGETAGPRALARLKINIGCKLFLKSHTSTLGSLFCRVTKCGSKQCDKCNKNSRVYNSSLPPFLALFPPPFSLSLPVFPLSLQGALQFLFGSPTWLS